MCDAQNCFLSNWGKSSNNDFLPKRGKTRSVLLTMRMLNSVRQKYVLPGGRNTGMAESSDRTGVWVLHLLPVQHSMSHFSKDHPLRALSAPPIAAQAAFLSALINSNRSKRKIE